MTKLESAITFGKVMFTMRPLFTESQKKLQSQLNSAFKEELEQQSQAYLYEQYSKQQQWGGQEKKEVSQE